MTTTENITISNDETIGSIAAHDYRKAEVFKKLGIDFCCGGNKTLKAASAEAGLSEAEVISLLELENMPSTKNASQDYNKWQPDFLVDFIINTHHRYIKDNVSVINEFAHKVAKHHGGEHPELQEFEIKIQHFLEDMINHMKKEELALFPGIKQLVANKNNPGQGDKMPAGFVRASVKMMQMDHEASGEDLQFFRRLTSDYSLPEGACNSYKFLFEKMKEFEDDLKQHIHLENNILFPKAIKLEEELQVKN